MPPRKRLHDVGGAKPKKSSKRIRRVLAPLPPLAIPSELAIRSLNLSRMPQSVAREIVNTLESNERILVTHALKQELRTFFLKDEASPFFQSPSRSSVLPRMLIQSVLEYWSNIMDVYAFDNECLIRVFSEPQTVKELFGGELVRTCHMRLINPLITEIPPTAHGGGVQQWNAIDTCRSDDTTFEIRTYLNTCSVQKPLFIFGDWDHPAALTIHVGYLYPVPLDKYFGDYSSGSSEYAVLDPDVHMHAHTNETKADYVKHKELAFRWAETQVVLEQICEILSPQAKYKDMITAIREQVSTMRATFRQKSATLLLKR